MCPGLYKKILSADENESNRAVMKMFERATEARTDKKKRERSRHVAAHPELSQVFIHTLPPSLFPLRSPSSRDVSFYHSTWFHTPRPNIRVDMNEMNTGLSFHRQLCPLRLFVSCYPLVLVGLYLSGPLTRLPACCLSIRPKTLLRTAVFLFLSLST